MFCITECNQVLLILRNGKKGGYRGASFPGSLTECLGTRLGIEWPKLRWSSLIVRFWPALALVSAYTYYSSSQCMLMCSCDFLTLYSSTCMGRITALCTSSFLLSTFLWNLEVSCLQWTSTVLPSYLRQSWHRRNLHTTNSCDTCHQFFTSVICSRAQYFTFSC